MVVFTFYEKMIFGKVNSMYLFSLKISIIRRHCTHTSEILNSFVYIHVRTCSRDTMIEEHRAKLNWSQKILLASNSVPAMTLVAEIVRVCLI